MEKEGGNRERMRKCRESISLHFLIFSPFPPHFLILSPFPRSPAARLQLSIYMLCVQCYKSHCVRSCFVWRGNAVVKTCIVRDLSPDKLWGFVK